MNKSEVHKLAVKKREWNKSLCGFDTWARKVVRIIKRELKYMIKWLFFYKSDDKAEKFLHIVEVLFVWVILTKTLFGI